MIIDLKKTVIVMLENNEDGAWGLVINKPIGLIPLAMLIDPSFRYFRGKRKVIWNKYSNILGWTC